MKTTTTVLIASIATTSFAAPAFADSTPPAVRTVQAPAVASPAYPASVPPAPCFWQGRAFSSGSTNPPGEVCVKGRWQ
jgi:hypothetical protein